MARRSNRTVASECWENPNIRIHLLSKMGTVLRRELKELCSDKVNSVLRRNDLNGLQVGSLLDCFSAELKQHAPLLETILTTCTCISNAKIQDNQHKNNRVPVIAAMILNMRWSNMSALHKIISLILYAGHASKMVLNFI